MPENISIPPSPKGASPKKQNTTRTYSSSKRAQASAAPRSVTKTSDGISAKKKNGTPTRVVRYGSSNQERSVKTGSSTANRNNRSNTANISGGKSLRRGKKSSGSSRPRRGTTRSRNSTQTYRELQKIKQGTSYNLNVTPQMQEQISNLPPLGVDDIRVVPVCGVEWITTNMTYVEFRGEIIIIDAGFGFTTPDTPGVDYRIPNTAYLKTRQKDIKGIVITHGHLDHVGGIPYVIEDLGFPPIYTREFGAIFIKKKLEEFPHLKDKVEIIVIDEKREYTQIGKEMKVKFFGLTHSIPDSTGVVIQTPYGGIVSTGDVRVENESGVVLQREIDQYAFFKDENILLMTIDSTGIPKSGWTISEQKVTDTIDGIMSKTEGRLFISAFSSQVERLMDIMITAKKHGRKVIFEGRSMKNNMAIAQELELTDFSHVIPLSEIDKHPDNQILVLLTGAQGEEFAALNRAARGDHKYIKFRRADTVVLSASVVPGNHYSVAQMKNQLFSGSYNIITYADDHVHASGHGTREELKWIHTQVPYKFVMPIHGEPYMLRMHADMIRKELGVPEENIVIPENGSVIEIRNKGQEIIKLDQKIPAPVTVVDGSYIGMLHKVLMDDRKALASDGMFVMVVSIDVRTGKLKKSPDLISRGFVYLRESKDLLNKTRNLIKRTVESYLKKHKNTDFEVIKELLSDKVTRHLMQHTHKEPLVIPVVLGV